MAGPLTAWRERLRRTSEGARTPARRSATTPGNRRRARRRERLGTVRRSLWRDPVLRARSGWVLLGTVTLALFWIAFGTSPTAYDMDRIGWGTAPFIAAAATLPLLLVRVAPLAGWVASASGAVALWLLLPPADLVPGTGSPWPWLVVHTLVLLALLAAVTYRLGWVGAVLVWLGTTLLLAGAIEGNDLGAGWAVATATVAAVGWLARPAGPQPARRCGARRSCAPRRSPRASCCRSGHASPATCTTSSPTACRSSPCRPRPRATGAPACRTPRSQRARLDQRDGPRGARRDPGAARRPARRDDPLATAPQPGVDESPSSWTARAAPGWSSTPISTAPQEVSAPGTSLTALPRSSQEALSNVGPARARRRARRSRCTATTAADRCRCATVRQPADGPARRARAGARAHRHARAR